HGLWKRHHDLPGPDGVRSLGPEIVFSSSDGIRYAGVAELTDTGTVKAIDYVRKNLSTALILSDREGFESESNIRELFASACPLKKGITAWQIDWMTLAAALCPRG